MDTAAALLRELEDTPEPPAIKRLRYSHEAMIDLIITNPGISQNELAAHFGYTAPWVSRIISSDAFQSQLAARREEIVDPLIRASVEESFRALVVQSLQILQEKLARPSHQVPDNLVLKAMELGARGLGVGGFGGQPPPAPPAPSADRLDVLADRLNALIPHRKERIIENGEIIEAERVLPLRSADALAADQVPRQAAQGADSPD